MFGKTLDFLSSKISTMSLSRWLGRQPSSGQFYENPQNKLSHTTSNIYPPKPLCNPLSTMHKWRAIKVSSGENISSTSLRAMILIELPHDNSRKLSWHFSWNIQWHTMIVFLWTSKELAWKSISKSLSISFWQN